MGIDISQNGLVKYKGVDNITITDDMITFSTIHGFVSHRLPICRTPGIEKMQFYEHAVMQENVLFGALLLRVMDVEILPEFTYTHYKVDGNQICTSNNKNIYNKVSKICQSMNLSTLENVVPDIPSDISDMIMKYIDIDTTVATCTNLLHYVLLEPRPNLDSYQMGLLLGPDDYENISSYDMYSPY